MNRLQIWRSKKSNWSSSCWKLNKKQLAELRLKLEKEGIHMRVINLEDAGVLAKECVLAHKVVFNEKPCSETKLHASPVSPNLPTFLLFWHKFVCTCSENFNFFICYFIFYFTLAKIYQKASIEFLAQRLLMLIILTTFAMCHSLSLTPRKKKGGKKEK